MIAHYSSHCVLFSITNINYKTSTSVMFYVTFFNAISSRRIHFSHNSISCVTFAKNYCSLLYISFVITIVIKKSMMHNMKTCSSSTTRRTTVVCFTHSVRSADRNKEASDHRLINNLLMCHILIQITL